MSRPLAALFLLTLALPAIAQDANAVKPINLDKLNTDKDETDPHIASNGLALYYSSNGTGKFDILISKRANVNSQFPDQTPTLEGRAERPVFGGQWTPYAPGFTVIGCLNQ